MGRSKPFLYEWPVPRLKKLTRAITGSVDTADDGASDCGASLAPFLSLLVVVLYAVDVQSNGSTGVQDVLYRRHRRRSEPGTDARQRFLATAFHDHAAAKAQRRCVLSVYFRILYTKL